MLKQLLVHADLTPSVPVLAMQVKMALLTLVVVMFLMVFLYTVDSLFRHMLKSSMKPMA